MKEIPELGYIHVASWSDSPFGKHKDGPLSLINLKNTGT